MVQYDPTVVATGQLVDGTDFNEYRVFLMPGQAYSFWAGGADTEGTGFIADPTISISGDPTDNRTAGFGPIVALDNAEGTNAVLNFTTFFNPGHYIIKVSQGSGAVGGGLYHLVIANRTYDADILDHVGPGDPGTDFALAVNDALHSDIGRPGDADVVAVTLTAGLTYSLDLRGADSGHGTLADPLLTLLDGNGLVLQQADNGGTGHDSHLDFTPGATGTFYLRAEGSGGGMGSYELKATGGPASDNVPGDTSTPFSAPVGGTIDGTIDSNGDTDRYAIQLAAGTTYRFDLVSSGLANPLLELRYGDSLTASDDNSGGGVNARLTYTPPSDEMFFLVARDTGAGTGGYSLTVTTTAGPAATYPEIGAGLADHHGVTMAGSDGNDFLTGTPLADVIDGGAGQNVISGLGGADLISGGAGSDMLYGVDGDDTLTGGAQHDWLDGGGGSDTASYVGSGPVSVSLAAPPNSGLDTLISIENLLGSNYNDRLTGNGGANVLLGSSGNDTLVGGAGRDLLTGGGGLDVMKYNALSESGTTFAARDVINTFAHGDKVDLTAIDANSKAAGNQAFTFTDHFTHVAGQLQWDQTAPTGYLVQGDVNGDGAADFSIQIYAAPGFGTIHNWDFFL